jgi:hypothetical protein
MATLHALDEKRFRCEHCLRQFDGRQDADQMLKREQKLKACHDILDTPRFYLGSDQELGFKTCIGNFYRNEIAHMYRWFLMFEKGVMPFEGPLSEQPNKIIEIFGVMEHYRNAKLEEIRRDNERKAKKAKGYGR